MIHQLWWIFSIPWTPIRLETSRVHIMKCIDFVKLLVILKSIVILFNPCFSRFIFISTEWCFYSTLISQSLYLYLLLESAHGSCEQYSTAITPGKCYAMDYDYFFPSFPMFIFSLVQIISWIEKNHQLGIRYQQASGQWKQKSFITNLNPRKDSYCPEWCGSPNYSFLQITALTQDYRLSFLSIVFIFE